MSKIHECVICLDSIKSGEEYQTPCCNQNFHKKCLNQWINSQTSKFKSCPHCREDLDCINLIKISNISLTHTLENFNFDLEIEISGNRYLITKIKKIPSGIIQKKVNIRKEKKTIPVYIFHAEIKSIDSDFTINYNVSLTTIYMCLKNVTNKCITKSVIGHAIIEPVVIDNNFYQKMADFNLDYSNYNCYKNIIKIID